MYVMVFILSLLLFVTLETKRELEPKCLPQLFLGSLLETRRSAIGQFLCLSLLTVPEVFAKIYSTQFTSRLLSDQFLTN